SFIALFGLRHHFASFPTRRSSDLLVVAVVIYLLSSVGGLSGLRLVVIGIAVNAMVTALNSWIVLRAELEVAIAAVGWSSGSLNRSEEHTSELSHVKNSYAVFCLKK